MSTRGNFYIDVWGDDRDSCTLEGSDVLVIPGGNTFDLLAHLQTRGWFDLVRHFHARGGHIYGGSAGAVLLGADISPALGANRNDAVLSDLDALDLLHGALIRPHYEPSLLDNLQKRADDEGRTIWGVPERGGVVVDGRTARASGPEPVLVFAPGLHRVIEQGGEWVLPGAGRAN